MIIFNVYEIFYFYFKFIVRKHAKLGISESKKDLFRNSFFFLWLTEKYKRGYL